MCDFFSLLSDGEGNIYYIPIEERERLWNAESMENPDSHTYIAHVNGLKGEAEDRMNKWEYNPVTDRLKLDKLNTTNDFRQVLERVIQIDFSHPGWRRYLARIYIEFNEPIPFPVTEILGSVDLDDYDYPLPVLTTIGGNVIIYGHHHPLPSLTTIRGYAHLRRYDYSLPALTTIGGDAYLDYYPHSLPALTTIGGFVFMDHYLYSLPSLKTVTGQPYRETRNEILQEGESIFTKSGRWWNR